MSVNISYPVSKTLTFIDILSQRASQQPEELAYTFLNYGKDANVSLTYAELDRQARSIAIKLQNLGYTGKLALLLYPSGLDYITAFLGCFYAGTIAVPLYPPHNARLLPRIQAIINDTQTDLVLTTAETWADMSRRFMHIPELRRLHSLATDNLPLSWGQHWLKPDLAENDLAFLQYTSGSTSTPKGVMVSHGNLLHNVGAMQTQWKLDANDSGISWLPMFHDMGLILGILQPLYVGYHTLLMSSAAFLQHPLRWLRAISDYKATITSAPNFAYELCLRRTSPADRIQLDLSHWQVAINGAEPIHSETLKNFSTTFAECGFHPDTFRPGYGLAEATLMATAGQRRTPITLKQIDKTMLEHHTVVSAAPENPQTHTLVGCGKPAPGQHIIVVHPEALTQCQPTEVGELWIAGKSVTQGYFGNAEETKNTFQAYLSDTGEGPFLRTGDLGFIENDEVFITGRLKDLLIIKGRNHYPQDIEYTVEQSSPIIRSGCVIAFSIDVMQEERLVVVAEVKLPQSGLTEHEEVHKIAETLKAIRRNISETHELTVYQVKLVEVGEVPKTSSGKLQRHACRARFLAGSLREWKR